MERETCDNCGRTIGKLEAAHIHNGHIVCVECIQRLTIAPGSGTPSEAAATTENERILFRHGDLSVTTTAIYNKHGRFPLEYALSVRPTRASFSFAINVEVIDLARGTRRYRLPNRGRAMEFIRAIQAAKGSINVESEVGGFILWW
jgi:hypothetical protein